MKKQMNLKLHHKICPKNNQN